MNALRVLALVALSPWLLVACGGETPPTTATPSAPSAPVAADAGATEVLAEPAEPTRPEWLLTVEGSDEDGVLFRGWPWRIQVQTLRGEAPTTLRIDGPAAVVATRVGTAWLVAEERTAPAANGVYTFTAGEARAELRVAEAPATLSAAQAAVRRRLQLWSSMARNDTAAARALVDGWVAAEPASAAARTALGDVLRAAGDRAGALAAYSEAVALVPEGMHPPLVLHRHYGEVLREQAAAAIAAGAAATGANDPAPVPPAPEAPAPAAGGAGTTPPGEIVPATAWTDANGLAATDGQWAVRATASSQYSAPQYAATQATGAPDVKVAGDAPEAWCPGARDDGFATLELEFATAAAATGVRVRQNVGPGAIHKVEAIAPDGSVHLWWQGRDPFLPGATRDFAWFVVRVPATAYAVARVRLTLDLAAVAGWNQIDAVQLVGAR